MANKRLFRQLKYHLSKLATLTAQHRHTNKIYISALCKNKSDRFDFVQKKGLKCHKNKCLPALFYITASHQLLHHASKKKDFVAQLCLWPSKRVSVKIIFKCFKRKACDRLPTVYPKIDNHFWISNETQRYISHEKVFGDLCNMNISVMRFL